MEEGHAHSCTSHIIHGNLPKAVLCKGDTECLILISWKRSSFLAGCWLGIDSDSPPMCFSNIFKKAMVSYGRYSGLYMYIYIYTCTYVYIYVSLSILILKWSLCTTNWSDVKGQWTGNDLDPPQGFEMRPGAMIPRSTNYIFSSAPTYQCRCDLTPALSILQKIKACCYLIVSHQRSIYGAVKYEI